MEIGPVGHSVMKVSCLTPSCYCRHVVVYIYIYIYLLLGYAGQSIYAFRSQGHSPRLVSHSFKLILR